MKLKIRWMMAAVCSLACLPAAAPAQTDTSKFPLSKIIPDDVFIAVSAKANPERKFLEAYWANVIKAFNESGVMTDVWDLMTESVPDEQLDEVESAIDRFSELTQKITWSQIFDKEMVYCGRFNPGTPGFHEGMFAGRSNSETAEKNYGNLKRLMAELVKFANMKAEQEVLAQSEIESKGAKCTALTFPEAPGIAITVANKGDIIFITFGGTSLLDDALDLMAGKGEKKPLISTPRFKTAIDQLPPAEDSLVFFDVERMMGTFRGMMEMIGGKHTQNADADAESENDGAPNPMKLVIKVLNDVSIVDYAVWTEHTDGYRVFKDNVTALKPNAKESPLYAVITSGKPTKEFEKFIPKEATSFGVSSNVNLKLVYRYVIGLVRDHVPEGKAMIKQWEDAQANELKLDVEKDVLDLFEGSTMNFQSGKDWVLALKVTDEKKMDAQFARLLATINGMMGQNALMTSKVTVDTDTEFTQISHPMMMMMGGMSPPVVGCAEGYFMIGSSVGIVKTCLKTAHGDHPNITSNPRWKEEALRPEGAIVSIGFTDQANMARDLQQAMGGMAMGMGMAGMMAGDAPPEARRLLNGIPPILAKLGTVAATLNFYKSKATYESFDGKKWTCHEVQNYKSPAERSPPETESTGEKANTGASTGEKSKI